MERTLITNARIITNKRILENASLLIEDDKIAAVREGEIVCDDCNVFDAQGQYLSPGFIDLHTHGAGGADFLDAEPEAYAAALNTHAKFGTTGLLATTCASSDEELDQMLDAFSQAERSNQTGARLLGIHLEGPYFAYEQRGAQDPRYLKNPDPAEYLRILDKTDRIRRWSVAPELPGALEMGLELQKRGIIASIAHTAATLADVERAMECGYDLVTHFYSCVSTIVRKNSYKFAGVVESVYLFDDLKVEIIADGKHIPSDLLKLVYKLKGPERIALITDSMRAAGTQATESILGSKRDGQPVVVEDDVAKLPDRSAFAGSVATTDRLVRNMVQLAGVPLVEAVKMASLTPAKILRIDHETGSILSGKRADLVLLSDDLHAKQVWVGGRKIL